MPAATAIELQTQGFSLTIGGRPILKAIDFEARTCEVTALMGPSGCGKSTLLRAFNRMNDLIVGAVSTGSVRVCGQEVNGADCDVVVLRRTVGMIFQKPTALPMSLAENVAYGLRLQGVRAKAELQLRVEKALREANLWDEVKDRLQAPATALSGGQLQRLCIARCLVTEPRVILMDEPTSALDPLAAEKIEQLIHQLKTRHTLLIVTHNLAQAQRVSDYTTFMYLGEILEYGPTSQVLTAPQHPRTQLYVGGAFG